MSGSREKATLAGGCFWCLEAVFERLKGVERVVSGYSGGSVDHPSYEQVCSGATGHAEAVQVTFDPNEISYRDILEVFFTAHDPTTLNRQGADVGTQYRSAVFYHSEEQRTTAEQVIRRLEGDSVWDAPIVTELAPFEHFYPAEDYHQRFYASNANHPYCRAVIDPKLAKIRERYSTRLKQ
jgi:peptide-methionine (S)-S-oxide reductase